ncbi:MAG: glycosyltransferase [Maricaulaceae bacterium]|jgi:glycosyltransferase involved in cell wall biosynthesis
MRILIVSDYGHVNGGAAKVAIDSALALAEEGCEVVFIYGVGPQDEALTDSTVECVHAEVEDVWTVSSAFEAARSAIWNEPARRELSRIFSAFATPNSVIHVHQWSKGFSPAVFAAARDVGRPVFLSGHDYFAVCPNGAYFLYGANAPCTKKPMSSGCLITGCDRISAKHKAVRVARHALLTRHLARLDDLTMVHVSEFSRSVAEPLTAVPAAHATVPNFAPPQRIEPVEPWRSGTALYCGRITAEKGCGLFAEAARTAGVKAQLLGDGPMRAELEADYPEHEFLGWRGADGVDAAFAGARVLVLPSLWYETFGLVVLEALGAGLPVIVSADTGAAEYVRHGETGWVIPRGDEQALAAALSEAMADDARIKAMSARARELGAPLELSRHGHVRALINLYREALSRRAAA